MVQDGCGKHQHTDIFNADIFIAGDEEKNISRFLILGDLGEVLRRSQGVPFTRGPWM